MVLEKTLESPLDIQEIKPVNPKGNQPWIFIGRTDAEAEAPILWSPDLNWLIWKDPDVGKIEGRRRRGQQRTNGWMTSPTRWTWVWANSRTWWKIGSLACCSPWGCEESDMTEWLNNNNILTSNAAGRRKKKPFLPWEFMAKQRDKKIEASSATYTQANKQTRGLKYCASLWQQCPEDIPLALTHVRGNECPWCVLQWQSWAELWPVL